MAGAAAGRGPASQSVTFRELSRGLAVVDEGLALDQGGLGYPRPATIVTPNAGSAGRAEGPAAIPAMLVIITVTRQTKKVNPPAGEDAAKRPG
jgi:hypothetical protein